MTKRILIDSRQTEETRVVLLSGTRIEDLTTKQNTANSLREMYILHG